MHKVTESFLGQIDVSIRDPFIWRLDFIELDGRDYVKPFQEHWC